MNNLSPETIELYSRQLILPGWSKSSQLVLAKSLLVSDIRLHFALRYIAAAGIGGIWLLGSDSRNPIAQAIIADFPRCQVSIFNETCSPATFDRHYIFVSPFLANHEPLTHPNFMRFEVNFNPMEDTPLESPVFQSKLACEFLYSICVNSARRS